MCVPLSRGGGGRAAEREDKAAAAVAGFEGVELDAEAAAAIQAALEACAARAREARAACEAGGEAAADAAEEDPGEPFFRSEEPMRGTMAPVCELDEFVAFAPGEAHWEQAGAEMPEEWAGVADEAAAAAEARGEGGKGGASDA